MKCFGEEVLEKFSTRKIEIGQCVTDRAMRACCSKLTPANATKKIAQEITPCGHRIDNGTIRSIHHTFTRVNRLIWQYKGKCFLGESVERGMEFAEYRQKMREEKKNGRTDS